MFFLFFFIWPLYCLIKPYGILKKILVLLG